MKPNVTYSLMDKEQNSDSFYLMLNVFSDVVLDSAALKLGNTVDDFYNWIKYNKIEKIRSKDEYTLELVTLGVIWTNYAYKAIQTNALFRKIILRLYRMRKQYPRYKKHVDKLRGALSFFFLEKKSHTTVDYSLHNFKILLEWLDATGEFTEEVNRLNNWKLYFNSLSVGNISDNLHGAIDFSTIFYQTGQLFLGTYTKNVEQFRRISRKEYKYREDYFFVQRSENEYFLNMFGAEVMNRHMKQSFENSSHKAILLPTCMRTKSATTCKAISDGKEKLCRMCDKNCALGNVAKEFVNKDILVYLIPHSSSFSEFLTHWADQKETALVGVACVLNLLTGGYEMKRLNIESQCVFLDYCSCSKHWSKKGAPTGLNINRLKQLLQPVNVLQEIN